MNKKKNSICLLAETYYRDKNFKFGIKTDDRRRHMYIIGKTGMGKTTLLENMVYSDILHGNGVCYIDPHGDAAERILDFIPSYRINDVIYFNPADIDYPISFNVLESVDPIYKHLVASGMVGVFKKIWADSWGPRLEYILRNCLLALLDYKESTLLGVTRMLVDKEYRKKILAHVKDPVVKSFWLDEFTKFNDRVLAEVISPIQNKVGQFLSTALIRNIVGQVKTSINFREIMDNKKILILNLSKGRIGEDASALLGAMMITKIQLAAMSRVDIPEEEREDFYLYVDEFQNFATESFADILSEARKYRLNLIIAHQYIRQLENSVIDAIFGNVGTIINFRVGASDAEILVKEYSPFFTEEDLVNLPKYYIYLKLMIDGVTSNPFSAKTLPPLSKFEGNSEKIIRVSRERYAKRREVVEDKIMRWSRYGSEEAVEIKEKSKKEEKSKDKQELKQEQKNFTYVCDYCLNSFDLDAELDTTKAIFCKECLKLKRAGKLEKFIERIEKEKASQLGATEDVIKSNEGKELSIQDLKNLVKDKNNKKESKQIQKSQIESTNKNIYNKIEEDEKNDDIIKPGQVIKF